jgi:hypothetical protein
MMKIRTYLEGEAEDAGVSRKQQHTTSLRRFKPSAGCSK